MNERVDVVVVGAGPVGLLAAIEPTLAGARAVVLERLAAPSTVTKALGMGPLATEALQRRGLGPALDAAEGRALAGIREFAERMGSAGSGRGSKIGGHFGGLFLIRRDEQAEPERRPRLVDQQAVEALLAERAEALGIEVRRGCDVTSFEPGDDGVDVRWATPTGTGQIRCEYLVGADGGRSSIRKGGGFEFPGVPPTMTMYSAAVTIDHPDRLFPIGWHHTGRGMFAFGPFPDRLILGDFSGPPADRQAPVTVEEVEGVLRRVSGADVRITRMPSANRWTDNTRLVDNYRRGRVLLAGDAAHVHTPFGGQGMSLGLGDAANLGWKLAAVVRGAMPASLLDTYNAERRPVAEAVLANTLAQAAIMRPDPQSAAMRALMAELLQFSDVNRFIGGMMTGLATRYDLGSGRDEVGRLIGDRPLAGGGSLYDLMHDGHGVLLDASPRGEASRVAAAEAPAVRSAAIEAGPSLLIRPDGCVAWLGEADGTDGLADALRRWFVPASAAAALAPCG